MTVCNRHSQLGFSVTEESASHLTSAFEVEMQSAASFAARRADTGRLELDSRTWCEALFCEIEIEAALRGQISNLSEIYDSM